MNIKPAGFEKIETLIERGVAIPNPLSVDIGGEVDVERISADGVTIFPGSRIYGQATAVCAGAQIGTEGPVTIQDCQVGPGVELKGGYVCRSVFLEGACAGYAAHVREGCILEEQASIAHCVGLKQTILFPFVTLGSLINFCDCLMAGGTGRHDHSEVGSSYIHFNFTPEGNKTTASLIGDVPRGVMLDQPRIFLGGQGGMVGPMRLDYGTVSVAGTILRRDQLEGGKLVIGKTLPETVADFTPTTFAGLSRILKNNIMYCASLMALEMWYRHVRRLFFERQDLGRLVYEGALDKLDRARAERTRRLKAMAEKIPAGAAGGTSSADRRRNEVRNNMSALCEVFGGPPHDSSLSDAGERFVRGFETYRRSRDENYPAVVQSMPDSLKRDGVQWLSGVVDRYCREAAAVLPSFSFFSNG